MERLFILDDEVSEESDPFAGSDDNDVTYDPKKDKDRNDDDESDSQDDRRPKKRGDSSKKRKVESASADNAKKGENAKSKNARSKAAQVKENHRMNKLDNSNIKWLRLFKKKRLYIT